MSKIVIRIGSSGESESSMVLTIPKSADQGPRNLRRYVKDHRPSIKRSNDHQAGRPQQLDMVFPNYGLWRVSRVPQIIPRGNSQVVPGQRRRHQGWGVRPHSILMPPRPDPPGVSDPQGGVRTFLGRTIAVGDAVYSTIRHSPAIDFHAMMAGRWQGRTEHGPAEWPTSTWVEVMLTTALGIEEEGTR